MPGDIRMLFVGVIRPPGLGSDAGIEPFGDSLRDCIPEKELRVGVLRRLATGLPLVFACEGERTGDL